MEVCVISGRYGMEKERSVKDQSALGNIHIVT